MLKGNNVIIRPMGKGDFEVFYSWLQDQKYLGDFLSMEMRYKDNFIEGFEKNIKDSTKFYAVLEDMDGHLIGLINSMEATGTNSTLELGMLIAEETSRGKGIGKEALGLYVDYLFKTKNIMRIQYITRTDNIGMKTIGEKNGFVLEGVMKKYKIIDGIYRDYSLMAITRDNWNYECK